MAEMGSAGIKVYIALCRQITGYQNTGDYVPLSTLGELTGMSRNGVRAGIQRCHDLGAIEFERRGKRGFFYIKGQLLTRAATDPGSERPSKGSATDPPKGQPVTPPKKERKVKKTSPSEKAVPANVDPLYDRLLNAFLRKNDEADWDFGREGQHIHKLLKKANARPDPAAFLSQLLETFYELTEKSPEKFWRSRPFLPSALNASGIYPQVVKLMRHQENGRMTPEQAQRIRATSFS